LSTPALVIDAGALERNLATMATARPGARLRPHVKAHKCTALAREQYRHGHHGFTCATVREVEGMVAAGLGDDLLLANEVVDTTRLARLGALLDRARITVAVDSEATIDAAARAGLDEVLVDVNVGLPRCGCAPEAAGELAELARARGLTVRGVMGYEGHVVGLADRDTRAEQLRVCLERLHAAHRLVGGELVSAGGTGTYDLHDDRTEVQAGSYALMDTAYAGLGLPFEYAARVVATVISVSSGFAVGDAGLKAFGMDHGNPTVEGGRLWFCSDEHTTFTPEHPVVAGQRITMLPAHIDPTMTLHERAHLVDADGHVLEVWPIDLRGW
jgi:D-serine deaminase-like pyridoxal phosphate-dependent protein